MRIVTVAVLLPIILVCGMTRAQSRGAPQPDDIIGTWQGTLHTGKDLRIVFKISSEDSRLRAVMYSIDQKTEGIPATSVTLQGSTLKIELPSLNGSYRGDVATGDDAISGYWTEHFFDGVALDLQRVTQETSRTIIQSHRNIAANDSPVFEVATIKPSNPDSCCSRTFSRIGRHFATTNTNLKYLMQYAYDLQSQQITGGPAWLDQDRFDVVGEVDGGDTPTDRQWKIAVQKLLVERFHLQFHREKKNLSAYALVVAKGGPKLVRSDGDLVYGQKMTFSGAVGQDMHVRGTNATLADFIGELQRVVLPRPVVDRTGLTGTFNIAMTFTREDPQAIGMGPTLPDNSPPGIFAAIQQQLGLKLESTKALVEILVIDHAERPSAN